MWGDNTKGQLGMNNLDSYYEPEQSFKVNASLIEMINCGQKLTLLVSKQNEIMISGKIPFQINNSNNQQDPDQSQETSTDFITTFQSIAQFDQQVKVSAVSCTRFASIVIDPQEQDQPRELFFWGETPLGVFTDLTPFN